MNRGGIDSYKSIPRAASISTLLSLSSHGTTGAVFNQGAARIDFNTLTAYHERLLKIQATTTGGLGGTPTSVGAAKQFILKYAWSNDLIDVADAPTVLSDLATPLVIDLPDAISVKASGSLTLAGLPVSGDAFYINAKSYVLRTTPTQNYEVKIAGTAAATATNIINAINNSGGVPGTDYIVGGANADVSAATGGAGVVTVTARVFGAVGNAIVTAEDVTNGSWGGANLTGGASTGTRQVDSDIFTHGGRYLYTWYDRDLFAANALIDVDVKLIRL